MLLYCCFAESVEENVHKIGAKVEGKSKPDALFFTVIGNIEGRERGKSYEGSVWYSDWRENLTDFLWRYVIWVGAYRN